MHMKNKPLSDANCLGRVSYSWANLYIPAPLVQVSRNRKWWTSHCLPGGTPLSAALSTKQRYKGIIADNICVTDGDQLLPPKETSTWATANNLWSNILAKWQLQEGRKCSEVKGMKGRGGRGGCQGWLNAVRQGWIDWQHNAMSNSVYGEGLNGKASPPSYSHSQDYFTNSCFWPWLSLCVGDIFMCCTTWRGSATWNETFELKWLWQAQVTGSLTNCIHH